MILRISLQTLLVEVRRVWGGVNTNKSSSFEVNFFHENLYSSGVCMCACVRALSVSIFSLASMFIYYRYKIISSFLSHYIMRNLVAEMSTKLAIPDEQEYRNVLDFLYTIHTILKRVRNIIVILCRNYFSFT